MPREIEMGRVINRFGAQAVYGRPMGVQEIRRIRLAERVESVCRKWLEPNSGAWFNTHPDDLTLFQWAFEAHKHARSQN